MSDLSRSRARMLAVALCIVLSGAFAAVAKVKKSDPGPHPLKVVKFMINDSGHDMGSVTGSYGIWLQNTSDYIVDKIKIEVEIYNKDGRLIDSVKRDVGKLNAGQKKIMDLHYNVIGLNSGDPVPHLWIYYNAGKDRLTQFEADTTSI